MMDIYTAGDKVIALQPDGNAWRATLIKGWLPRAQKYQVRFWRWADGKWGPLRRIRPQDILGPIEGGDSQSKVINVAQRLLAYKNMREAAIENINRDLMYSVMTMTNRKGIDARDARNFLSSR